MGRPPGSKNKGPARLAFGKEHRGRGRGLTVPEKTAIYQAYLALGSKKEVERSMNVPYSTVLHVCKAMEKQLAPREIEVKKQQMADALNEQFFESTQEILDSIRPDDIESGRIEIRNAKGELEGYKYFGPSLLQKATTAGIFTDKMRVLRDYSKAVADDAQTGKLLMPESVDQLIAAIKGRITSIKILDVNFAQNNPDLATRVEQAIDVTPAETETRDERLDLRNPA